MGWLSHTWHRATRAITHIAPVVHHAISRPARSVFHHIVGVAHHIPPAISHVAGPVGHVAKQVAKGTVSATKTIYHDAVQAAKNNSPAGLLRQGGKEVNQALGTLANSPYLWIGLAAGGVFLLSQNRN